MNQLSHELPESFALREVSAHDRAVQLASVSRPEVLIVDATRGQWPQVDFSEKLGYRAAIIYLVDDPAAAQRAYDAGAIDSLLFPIQPERLLRALQRAQHWTAANRSLVPSGLDFAEVEGACRARWLRIARNGEVLVTRLDEVIYLQAERKVTRVVLDHADGYLRLGISTVAAQLDPHQFWRIHRGTIVNGNHVSTIRQDELGRTFIRLRGRTENLAVSRVHERVLLRDGLF